MKETFLTDREYESWFADLGGIRRQVARSLPVRPGMTILDLACGYGYFTVELARLHPQVHVTGIDLLQRDVEHARATARRHGMADRVEVRIMDATAMAFPDKSFDLVANFGGLEDIHMTRGSDGVWAAFGEVYRVLKPGTEFWFTAMPPDEASTSAQRLENQVFSFICNATWLNAARYETMLRKTGFSLRDRQVFYTGRKLTSDQARQEMLFACGQVPDLYGIEVRPFTEVWTRFGPEVEKHGLGQFSRVVLFCALKSE